MPADALPRKSAKHCLSSLSEQATWQQPLSRRPAALQDESACIGCKQCVWCASGVFRMEPEYGRSRVFAQWCDPEDRIQVQSLRPPATSPHKPLRQGLCTVVV